jgi:hypothetical protein
LRWFSSGFRADLHTLQPTALVHEACLRLVGNDRRPFNNRVHFYGAAAHAMRRILIDHARRRQAHKRGDDPAMVSSRSVRHPIRTPIKTRLTCSDKRLAFSDLRVHPQFTTKPVLLH